MKIPQKQVGCGCVASNVGFPATAGLSFLIQHYVTGRYFSCIFIFTLSCVHYFETIFKVQHNKPLIEERGLLFQSRVVHS